MNETVVVPTEVLPEDGLFWKMKKNKADLRIRLNSKASDQCKLSAVD